MQTMPRALPKLFTSATETELIARAASGDGSAFEAIMRRYNQLLFRAARGIVLSDTEAEDVVQEAYLHAWRALAQYRAESKLSTWLARITINEALRRVRRKSAELIPLEAAMASLEPATRAALTEEPERDPERSTMRDQMRKLIEKSIDLLPESFRTVFILRAIEEMSVEDVAHVLDIPQATVRTRFFRARSLLRENLAQKVDMTLADAFSFDGARCDRIVATVLARARAEGLARED